MKSEWIKYTWNDLKNFIPTLSEDQLQQEVLINLEDEPVKRVEPEILDEDIYQSIDEPEEGGTLTDLKEALGDEFNIDEFRISFPKGTVILTEV